MTLIEHLLEVVSEKTKYVPDRWVKEWLLPSPVNQGRILPMNAPFTFVTGLRLLFELPFQAIANRAEEETKVAVAPFVAIGDSDPTAIIMIDTTSGTVVGTSQIKAWEFRFPNERALIEWMREETDKIVGRLRRTS